MDRGTFQRENFLIKKETPLNTPRPKGIQGLSRHGCIRRNLRQGDEIPDRLGQWSLGERPRALPVVNISLSECQNPSDPGNPWKLSHLRIGSHEQVGKSVKVRRLSSGKGTQLLFRHCKPEFCALKTDGIMHGTVLHGVHKGMFPIPLKKTSIVFRVSCKSGSAHVPACCVNYAVDSGILSSTCKRSVSSVLFYSRCSRGRPHAIIRNSSVQTQALDR